MVEGRLAPEGREEEYRRVMRLIRRGPFRWAHYAFGLGLGVAVPLAVLAAAQLFPMLDRLVFVAAALVLLGLWVEDDVLVRAGQALPIS